MSRAASRRPAGARPPGLQRAPRGEHARASSLPSLGRATDEVDWAFEGALLTDGPEERLTPPVTRVIYKCGHPGDLRCTQISHHPLR